MNVWTMSADGRGQPVNATSALRRPIRLYTWAYTNDHILYLEDEGGDENYHLFSVDLSSGAVVDLTPGTRIQAKLVKTSPDFPALALVAVNDRVPQLHDLYRVDVRTAERTLVHLNVEGILFYHPKEDFTLGMARRMTADGGMEILERANGEWTSFLSVPGEDAMTTEPVSFDATGGRLYLIDSRGRDTSAMTAIDCATRELTVIAENGRADVADRIIDPVSREIQAVAFNYLRKTWTIVDPRIADDIDYLAGVADGDMEILSRSLDDSLWTVSFLMDDGPARYYVYDRAAGRARFLFASRQALEGLSLASMRPVIVEARDGLPLVCYYSLPARFKAASVPDAPLPMVLWIHGGPWSRDSWGYSAMHQLYADRGYAVLSVNYRGSTGFGKRHLNAGDLEWGRKMHDDLIDAVDWAVRRGIADPSKVAISGGSYGGYATLVGLSFTPDVFACGVDLVGPSNLVTFMETLPPYWAPLLEVFTKRTGDHRTAEGRALLTDRSPLSRVDAIKKPLLIAQGANDPRVKRSESDQLVEALKTRGIPVTYLLYPDEGHGFARPQNSVSFMAVTEAFLSGCLGGRFEPIGDDIAGSSIEALAGGDAIPGLDEALRHTNEHYKPGLGI